MLSFRFEYLGLVPVLWNYLLCGRKALSISWRVAASPQDIFGVIRQATVRKTVKKQQGTHHFQRYAEESGRGSSQKDPNIPKVTRPNIDVCERRAIARHANLARAIVENYRRTVDFSLEGIKPLSRWRLRLSGVAHRHFGDKVRGRQEREQLVLVSDAHDGWTDCSSTLVTELAGITKHLRNYMSNVFFVTSSIALAKTVVDIEDRQHNWCRRS